VRTIADLRTSKRCFALFGSGHSVPAIPKRELYAIKQSCFTVFTNYAFCSFDSRVMDMLLFGDYHVGQWVWQHRDRNVLLWTREQAFQNGEPSEFHDLIDFWLEDAPGTFTLLWGLWNLRKHHPDKPVLLFGVDMHTDDAENVKWYDKVIPDDKDRRIDPYPAKRSFARFTRDFAMYVKPEGVYNCNPDSGLGVYPRVYWREVVSITTPTKGRGGIARKP